MKVKPLQLQTVILRIIAHRRIAEIDLRPRDIAVIRIHGVVVGKAAGDLAEKSALPQTSRYADPPGRMPLIRPDRYRHDRGDTGGVTQPAPLLENRMELPIVLVFRQFAAGIAVLEEFGSKLEDTPLLCRQTRNPAGQNPEPIGLQLRHGPATDHPGTAARR